MVSNQVSAIVPIKNGFQYISSTIPNILLNLLPGDELIVVDDSSDDGSLELIQDYCKQDSRIHFYRNPGSGIVDALNHGLLHAKHEIVARFDIDDEYPVNRISKQREYLKSNVVAVFCDYNIISDTAEYLGTIYSPVFPLALKLSLSQGQRTPHPAVIFSKKACLDVGGYRKGDEGVEDLSLWLRLSKIGDLISVPEILFSYRIHANSTTFLKRKEILLKKERLLKEFSFTSFELAKFREDFGNIAAKYRSTSQYYARVILLARELMLVGSLKDRTLSLFKILLVFLRMNPYVVFKSIISIRNQSRRRKLFRSSHPTTTVS